MNDVIKNDVDIPNEKVEKYEEPNLTTEKISDDEKLAINENRVEKENKNDEDVSSEDEVQISGETETWETSLEE